MYRQHCRHPPDRYQALRRTSSCAAGDMREMTVVAADFSKKKKGLRADTRKTPPMLTKGYAAAKEARDANPGAYYGTDLGIATDGCSCTPSNGPNGGNCY